MECREATEYLLGMDNGEELPSAVSGHLQRCERCRREFTRVITAVTSLTADTEGETQGDAELTRRVMQAVKHEPAPGATLSEAFAADDQPTSVRNWIIVGIVLFGGVLVLRFSEVMTWLRQFFGPAIDLAMSIILGVFLTGYICVFVASNLSRVTRVFRPR